MSFDQPVLLPSSAIPRLPRGSAPEEVRLMRSLDFAAFESTLTVPGTLDRPLVSRSSQPWKIRAWRVQSQTNEVEQAFCRALEAGTHQYFHHTELGVGATTLLQHLMRQFNATQARRAAQPMRVCYLSLGKSLSAASRLLDAIGATIEYPISISDLRYRSMTRVMDGVCEHLRRTRTIALIIDHLHRANNMILGTLVEFAEALDKHHILHPNAGEPGAEPLTLLFAGTHSPETLASDYKNIWTTIGGRTAQIAPLHSHTDIRCACEAAFGPREYRWSKNADDFFKKCHSETRGLNTHLVSLFQRAAQMLRSGAEDSLEAALRRALAEATSGPEEAASTRDDAAPVNSAEEQSGRPKKKEPRSRLASEKRVNAAAASRTLRQRGFTGRRP